MERADHDLAFMLRYENVAWYENGQVLILDRRIYPRESYVVCREYQEVVMAIADMVTQSAGPYAAAGMGMALAAHQCREKNEAEQRGFLQQAAYDLSHARPTTTKRMEIVTAGCLQAGEQALLEGRSPCDAIFQHTVQSMDKRYRKIDKMATHLVELFPPKGVVMTQCFGEAIVGLMLRECRAKGKEIHVICPETRPYLQGARLTASVACDMGFDVTVITDNMPACTMQEKKVDIFTSAADAICMDGHVVNKVGTFQIAIVAKYLGIPYFVTGAPDRGHDKISTVTMEYRDEKLVLEAMARRTAMDGVKGFYPAFDITPPHLVSGVVTDLGIFTPYDLARYYGEAGEGEY